MSPKLSKFRPSTVKVVGEVLVVSTWSSKLSILKTGFWRLYH